jgi:hypothetical protein
LLKSGGSLEALSHRWFVAAMGELSRIVFISSTRNVILFEINTEKKSGDVFCKGGICFLKQLYMHTAIKE